MIGAECGNQGLITFNDYESPKERRYALLVPGDGPSLTIQASRIMRIGVRMGKM